MKKMLRGIRRHEALLEEGGRFCGVAAAMVGSAVIGAGASAASSKSATKAANQQSQAAVEASKGDPRMQAILYGNGTSPGLLNQIAGMANQNPQSANMAHFGQQMQNMIGQDGYNNWAKSNSAAQGLQGSNISAPQMQASQAQWASMQPAQANMGQAPQAANSFTGAAQINAPAQNGTNLNPAFNDMIYGNPAENQYLKDSIQGGIDQSMAAFKSMQADATDNLTEKILPSIRSNSIMSGGFGGSRQALAEGGALGDFSKQMATAAENFGRANTTAAVGAQAQAFDNGQNRALSAMGQLNGNQYGTAAQNAGFQQSANQQNSSQMLNNNQFNTGLLQQLLMGNLGYQQQANQTNAGFQQQTGLANAGWQNAASQNNQQAQQSTNALNSANQATGIGLSQGLGNQAFNWGQAQDNSQLNYLGQISGLLQGFTGFGTPTQQSQPYYSNTASSALGGAAAGLGLYNQFNQLGNSGGSSNYNAQDLRNNWQAGSGTGYMDFNVSP